MNKLKALIDILVSRLCIITMLMLVICVVWQVFSRFVLNSPSTATDEIARFSMIWVGLLGAAYTVGLQKHLSIDLFTCNLSERKKKVNTIFTNLMVAVFASGSMIFGGINLVNKVYTTGQVAPALQIPMAYIYVILPLSGALIVFYNLVFIRQALEALKSSSACKSHQREAH